MALTPKEALEHHESKLQRLLPTPIALSRRFEE
jgi:hypothetical protein